MIVVSILYTILSHACLPYYTLFSQAELTNKMEKKIATLRNGTAQQLLTRLLVPGDVVLLVGGCEVPADIE